MTANSSNRQADPVFWFKPPRRGWVKRLGRFIFGGFPRSF